MVRQGRSPQRQSPWPIIGALVGWALITVVGAGQSVDDSLLGVDGLNDVWAAIMVGAAFMGLMVFIYLNPFSRNFNAPKKRRRGRGGIVAAIVLLVLVWRPSLLDWLLELGENQETVDPEVQAGSAAGIEAGADGETSARDTVAEASDVLILLAALAAVAAVWWFVRSRLVPESELGGSSDLFESPETGLASAVGEASLALDAEDDPRLGVLKAYAILERTLADQGAPRMSTETPREHLQRALGGLAINASPLLALADLYELARFSERPITPTDRSRAAELLDQARHELLTSGAR